MEKIEPKITEIMDKRRKGRINKLNQIKYKKDKKQGEMNMRKNVNKKSNNRSKVVSALAMLLVGAVALSSASYAWFTMSKQVKVTGIELTATAPDNILIATNSAHEAIGDYASVQTLNDNTKTNDVLVGGTTTAISDDTLLYPASSLDGVNNKIFQTEDIQDEGGAKTDAKFEAAINNADNNKVFYVDVPLFILTTGSEPVKVAINQKQSEIINGSTDGQKIYKAVKFAVLNADESKNIGGTYESKDAEELFGNPVIAAGTLPATGIIADTDSVIKLGTANATILNANKIELAGSSSNGTVDGKYTPTEVTVRIWIEGQSKACVTANANQNFKFNLVFDAVDAQSGN